MLKYDYRLIDCFAAGMVRLLRTACSLTVDELMSEFQRFMGIYRGLLRGQIFDEDQWLQIGVVVAAMDPTEPHWRSYGRNFVMSHPLLGLSAVVA